jgi:hypothetical protein
VSDEHDPILSKWLIFDPGSIIGMLTMLATMPLPGIATKWNAQYQQKRMEAVCDLDVAGCAQADDAA